MRPLTVDQVRMLQQPNVVSEAAQAGGAHAGRRSASSNPHAMATIVPGYLERFRPHGQFASYRG